MRLPKKKISRDHKHVLAELKEGFLYVGGFPPIKYILLILMALSLLGMPYAVLLPAFSRDILGGDSRTLGFLTGSAGAGALTGALYLASRKTILGMAYRIAFSACIMGIGLAAFSFSGSLPFSLAMLYLVGLGMMLVMAGGNTIMQTVVEEDKRGRVMSFMAMASLGIAPFGSLLAGTAASHMGPRHTLLIGGICCFVSGLLFLSRRPIFRAHLRPIYREMGIIERMPDEVQ
jgi:MFS family permease